MRVTWYMVGSVNICRKVGPIRLNIASHLATITQILDPLSEKRLTYNKSVCSCKPFQSRSACWSACWIPPARGFHHTKNCQRPTVLLDLVPLRTSKGQMEVLSSDKALSDWSSWLLICLPRSVTTFHQLELIRLPRYNLLGIGRRWITIR